MHWPAGCAAASRARRIAVAVADGRRRVQDEHVGHPAPAVLVQEQRRDARFVKVFRLRRLGGAKYEQGNNQDDSFTWSLR